MKNEVKFGFAQIPHHTPLWAKLAFRIVFLLLSVASFMVTDYPGLADASKLILLKWFAGINMLTWGLSKMFGINPDTLNDR